MDTVKRSYIADLQRDAAGGTITAILSTENPCGGIQGPREVLVHDEQAVNLRRASRGLPVTWAHDSREFLGKAHPVTLIGRQLRAELNFSGKERAQEVKRDVQEGLLDSVSIEARIDISKSVMERDGTVFHKSWEPVAVSMVSTGEDADARVLTRELIERIPKAPDPLGKRKRLLETFRHEAWLTPALERDCLREGVSDDEARAMLMRAMGQHGFGDLPMDTNSHHEGPAAGAASFQPLDGNGHPAVIRSQNLGDSRPREFSITRILAFQAEQRRHGSTKIDIGFEREVSEAIEQHCHRRAQGMFVPLTSEHVEDLGAPPVIMRGGPSSVIDPSLLRRDLTVAGNAAALKPTMHVASDFIEALFARSVVLRSGATRLTGLVGNVDVPKLATSATAAYFDLDGTPTITESDPVTAKVTLTPKNLAGLVEYSYQTLVNSSPDIDRLVRDNLATVIARKLDSMALTGDGSGANPTGILNITDVLDATGDLDTPGTPAALSHAYAVQMEANIEAANAGEQGPKTYITASADLSQWKTTAIDSGSGQFLLTGGDGEGMVNGMRARWTTHMTTKFALLGAFSECLVGMWGGLDVLADPYSKFTSGTVAVRAILTNDINVRHPESFCFLEYA